MQRMPKNNCNTNTDATKESNAKQEIHEAVKCCTNMNGLFKNTNKSNESTVNTNSNTLTKYFLVIFLYDRMYQLFQR